MGSWQSEPMYAIWRRLRRQWDMIAEWRAKRHVFAAFFGRDGLEPFDEMESVLRTPARFH